MFGREVKVKVKFGSIQPTGLMKSLPNFKFELFEIKVNFKPNWEELCALQSSF